MDGSNGRVKGIPKQSRGNHRSQLHQLRCADPESLMEYEDSFESSVRYADPKPIAKPRDRERSQPRQLGRKAWAEQD